MKKLIKVTLIILCVVMSFTGCKGYAGNKETEATNEVNTTESAKEVKIIEVTDKLLPIGSVVLLKESTKKVMIYGRLQKSAEGASWDYVACLYPEGNINADSSYLFNQEQIESIYFVGFQDEEELKFNDYLESIKE